MKIFMVYGLALALVLISTGCSDSESRQIDQLTRLQKDTQENLMECKNQLEVYRGVTIVNNSNEETTSSEPEYEEVDIFELASAKTSCYEREVEECGLTFSDCKDGWTYRCMKDVKYKVNTERKLVE